MRKPSQTLYCNNLNDQITKQDLRRNLYHLFSQYGTVIDVVALKTPRLRGQAWIVFDEVMAATNAMRQLQGFPVFDKALRIDYAKTESDAAAKLKGKFIPRHKRKKNDSEQQEDQDNGGAKRISDGSVGGAAGKQKARTATDANPNNKLLCSELPAGITDDQLTILFSQYRGFQKARLVEGKNLAFIDFEDIEGATLAMERLQDFKLSQTHNLHINFAK